MGHSCQYNFRLSYFTASRRFFRLSESKLNEALFSASDGSTIIELISTRALERGSCADVRTAVSFNRSSNAKLSSATFNDLLCIAIPALSQFTKASERSK